MGAAVALLFAEQFPDRVDRIMAVSTPLAASTVSKRLIASGGSSLLDRVLGRRALADYPEVDIEATKTDPNAVLATARSLETLDLRGAMDELDGLPTLLVYGSKDSFITPLSIEDWRDFEGNVRPINLADSGHFPMIDEANKFQRLLRDFWEPSQRIWARWL